MDAVMEDTANILLFACCIVSNMSPMKEVVGPIFPVVIISWHGVHIVPTKPPSP